MSDFLAASAEDVIDPIVIDADAAAAEDSPAADPTDQPAAAAESVHDYIMRGLTADAPDADPETADVDPEPPATDPVAKPEGESAEESPEKEPSDSEDQKPVSEPNSSIKIVGRDEIEKQFTRAPKEIREVAAQNAEVAFKLQTQLEAFGGEHFAEPMQMIAKGLQEDDNVSIVHGVLAAQGVDGFTGLMADILQVALIDAPKADLKDEGNKYFAEACETVATKILQDRFGEAANPALIEKLVKYHSEGLIDTTDIDEYYQEHGDGKSAPSPLLKEQAEKIQELERKLAESQATETDAKAGDEKRFVESWTAEISTESDTILEDLYFKQSLLKPVKGDTPEVKAGKEQVKKFVLEAAKEFQKADPKFKKLQAAAYRGNAGTSKYKADKAALVDATVLHAKKIAAPVEALVAQIYALGRNANIPAKDKTASAATAAKPDPQFGPKQPTVTQEAKREPMTLDQWNKHMTDTIANLG